MSETSDRGADDRPDPVDARPEHPPQKAVPDEAAPSEAVTQLTAFLSAAADGDAAARARAWRDAQAELRRIAKALLSREGQRGDLQTTVLIQEAYLRLDGGAKSVKWESRRQFFASAGKAMHRFLVDQGRKRGRRKRGGGRKAEELTDIADVFHDPDLAIDLDEALRRLAELDPDDAEIARLRSFCGLTNDQIAEALDCSARKIDLDWRRIRAQLMRWLSSE
ncbi:MAG: sigma-70 family RNA polymerase sigma factor [Phycisphaerales bacterium]|nr:sigma-70 family RNA polymerase sigma factor [Phycisphaerales bacterium]